MMRLTRKLYSEPDDEDEDEKDEKTWKRRRNIGIIGAGTGAALSLGGQMGLRGEKTSKAAQRLLERDGGQNFRRLKGTGLVLGAGGAILGVGSELKRRRLKKKKNDENKA